MKSLQDLSEKCSKIIKEDEIRPKKNVDEELKDTIHHLKVINGDKIIKINHND